MRRFLGVIVCFLLLLSTVIRAQESVAFTCLQIDADGPYTITPSDAYGIGAGFVSSSPTITVPSQHGTCQVVGQNIVYTPTVGYRGLDSIQCVLQNGSNQCLVRIWLDDRRLLSHEGTEFYYAFLQGLKDVNNVEGENYVYCYLRILCRFDTRVHVTKSDGTYSVNDVKANTYLEIFPLDRYQTKAHYIRTTAPVVVESYNYTKFNQDLATVIPIRHLGQTYSLFTIKSVMSQFAVVATEDNTNVQVDLSDEAKMLCLRLGQSTLNKGEVAYWQTKDTIGIRLPSEVGDEYGPLSGTIVSANHPIAVIEGHPSCLLPNYPAIVGRADHMEEQAYSEAFMGTEFIVVGNDVVGDHYAEVTTLHDNTIITTQDSTVVLQRKGVYRFPIRYREAKYIKTSQPASCALFLCGSKPEDGDPSSVRIYPLSTASEYSTYTIGDISPSPGLAERSNFHFLNIICRTSEQDGIKVDGQSVHGFRTVPNSGQWSYAVIPMENETTVVHHVVNTNGTFTGYAYGIGETESYSYPLPIMHPYPLRDTIYDTICAGEVLEMPPYRYTQTGKYEQSYKSFIGLDSLIRTIYLEVLPKYEATENYSICIGDTLLWHGKEYTQTGTDMIHLTSSYGCDSVIYLSVTATNLLDPLQGLPMAWGGWNEPFLTDTIIKPDTITAPEIQPVAPPFEKEGPYQDLITYKEICDVLEWNGHTIYKTGLYRDTFEVASGCDSIGYLNVTRLQNEERDSFVFIYTHQLPYLLDNVLCYGDTTFTISSPSTQEQYCLLLTNYHLQVLDDCVLPQNILGSSKARKAPNPGDTPLDPGDSYCSKKTLADTTIVYKQLQKQPLFWFNHYYSEPGVYHDTIHVPSPYSFRGCDSIGVLVLRAEYVDTVNTCGRDTTFQTPWGEVYPYSCDSVYGCVLWDVDYGCLVDMQLTISREPCSCDTMRVETDTIVPYQEKLQYLWFGQMRDSAGVYRDTIETVDGCDSIGTLILRTSYSDEQTICQPDSAIFETPWGKIGVHHDSICIDTILLKHDTINLVYARLCVTREECSCDTMRDTTDITLPYDTLKAKGGYMWFGQMRDSAGVYRDTIETVEGCDSIGLLILRVAYERDTIVCGDDTAVFKTPWGEIGLDSCECKEGWIRKTADNEGLVWAKLCVTRLYADTVREDTTLCYGTSIVWHGITIDQTKEYEYHEPFTRLMTCDSVVYYLDATIKPEPQPHKTIDAVCAGETYIWTTYRDSIIEGPGTYYDTLWTDHGCYSDYYELELTHKALSIGANDTTVCGLPVVWEDSTWYESGVKTKILKNAVGCDSVVTLTLYVNEPTDQKDQDTIVCYGETIFWRNRLWKDLTKDSTLRDTLKYNGSPCDSIRYERLVRVRAQVKDSVSCEYACYGADVEWRGQKVMNITATQILTDMVAYKGTTCDSIHFEHTILVQKADTLPEYKTICYGQTYHWKRNGKQDSIVSTSGIYKDTVRYAATGCDSAIYVLDLKVDAINKDSVNQTTCQGTPYLWRGKELTIDSIYRDTATAKTSAECDTVYILKLTVNPILYGTPEEQTICEGDSILWSGKYYKEAGTYKDTMASVITGCDSIISLVLSTKKCCPDTIHRPTTVNMCDTLLPYTWHTYRDILVDHDTLLTDTLRTERGCDSIIYILNLTTYHCCRPNMAATMEVMDVCADATLMDVIVDLSSGEFDRYRVHYDNAPGNKMPFRDTMITLPAYYGQTEHILLNPPVPHDAIDRTNYPRPDEYAMTITLYNACGDSLNLGKQTFDVRYPSWILDQHWDDVIAILNDRYNGGYTFSRVEWLRDDEILAGEDELYIYLPHQLWTSPQGQYHDYYYQARLTRADDGKTMITCPMVPHHIDSTNVLTEPYVAVTPTLVHQENPIVYVQTNTKGTYWVYDTTGKLLQTADYEPTDHNVFDIQLYNVQTMYILVFTPREETKPLQNKYRVVKVLVE